MKKVFDKVVAALAAVRDSALWALLGKKLMVILAGLALNAIHAKFPELPLPSTDVLVQLIMAFLACHTLTDVVAILKGAAAKQLAMQGLSAALDKFKGGAPAEALKMLEDLVKDAK
jgi:hypothetical protein